MSKWIALFAACLTLCLFAAPASARTVQESASIANSPILELDIPDDWTDFTDGSGNLILVGELDGGVIAFSITVVADPQPLDPFLEWVWSELNATVTRVGDAQVSVHAGGRYIGSFTHTSGDLMNLENVGVKIGEEWIATVTMVYTPSTPESAIAAGRAVIATARIR